MWLFFRIWSSYIISSKLSEPYQAKFNYDYEKAKKWWAIRVQLREFVANNRVGIWGPRPFGSRAKVVQGLTRKATGARLRKKSSGPSAQQPLGGVFQKVKSWLETERSFGQEIRTKHVVQRLKYEMEHEADVQEVLKEHEDARFNKAVLKACEEKLAWLQALIVRINSSSSSNSCCCSSCSRSCSCSCTSICTCICNYTYGNRRSTARAPSKDSGSIPSCTQLLGAIYIYIYNRVYIYIHTRLYIYIYIYICNTNNNNNRCMTRAAQRQTESNPATDEHKAILFINTIIYQNINLQYHNILLILLYTVLTI